jgi:hypothetical protein
MPEQALKPERERQRHRGPRRAARFECKQRVREQQCSRDQRSACELGVVAERERHQ